jgi:hypothetical protein
MEGTRVLAPASGNRVHEVPSRAGLTEAPRLAFAQLNPYLAGGSRLRP